MNTPDNCYADKSHSAHDLLAPGEKCKACGFVADAVLGQEAAGVANRWELYASHEALRARVAALEAAGPVTDLHRRALEACEARAKVDDTYLGPMDTRLQPSIEACIAVGRESLAARKPKP